MNDGPPVAWTPAACTLPTAQRPLRRAEFDDVFRAATKVERLTECHVRLRLTGSADLADRVRDLAARENDCCSFFAFTVTGQPPDRVIFDVKVPAGHIDVLDALVEHAIEIGHRP